MYQQTYSLFKEPATPINHLGGRPPIITGRAALRGDHSRNIFRCTVNGARQTTKSFCGGEGFEVSKATFRRAPLAAGTPQSLVKTASFFFPTPCNHSTR